MKNTLLPDLNDEAQIIVWNQYIEMKNRSKTVNDLTAFNPKLDRLKSYLKSIKADLRSNMIGLQSAYDMIQDCVSSYRNGWYC